MTAKQVPVDNDSKHSENKVDVCGVAIWRKYEKVSYLRSALSGIDHSISLPRLPIGSRSHTMPSSYRALGGALLLASSVLAQNGAPSPLPTTNTPTAVTSAGPSRMTAKSALKLAKMYTADTFLSEWDFFDEKDPTNGYVK